MSNTFAIVENGNVVNIALSEAPLADNWFRSDEAQIGWSYNGSTFSPPPEPEPEPPTKEEQQAKRAEAYRKEADPLFFQYQRGEATQQEWLDKIEEIRSQYPYPEA
jgi:adenylate kinase family enzyme